MTTLRTPQTTAARPSASWWWRRSRGTRLSLSISAIVIGSVIIAIPFSPWILYHAVKPAPVYPYPTKLSGTQYLPTIPDIKKNTIPTDNRLVIPKIGVDNQIVEGADEKSLNRGIWHFPSSSTPDKGGNTVLTGHRFQYLAGPHTLYLLDQMAVGDIVMVYWKGVEYDYIIRERKIVNPDQISILDNTAQPQLTIFTCTPLFTTQQRLVLLADPITH